MSWVNIKYVDEVNIGNIINIVYINFKVFWDHFGFQCNDYKGTRKKSLILLNEELISITNNWIKFLSSR